MNKLKLTDTLMSVVTKMSDGNPGAVNILMQILHRSEKIDPDGAMDGFGPIFLLDTYGIYGTDIYVLHNDICHQELSRTLAVLRACQLGFFSNSVLKNVCSKQDYSGRALVPVAELYEKVKERLPNFDNE
jgi:hypothetical protein